ncbi:hypothetical protein COT78_04165 [Candidatus Berkelbacteria bacterium CG10_big_fil_rev_8_21_14_0_10_43_13]|uniref:Uncharacterized protein n=1 Tax=Candidatus Berkelbacteria bacterium CG10_big_fil_rev_8_21_14_0_10_43_13 TaxID=1974514 RepID=A0A2H0W5G9_9BACT|nr:MAG: hypothetical protein COT78_04165 [Candidatus Berkelbacteria bacterium CG10_big_fil_rev_8_21_14_0_10_43_13]
MVLWYYVIVGVMIGVVVGAIVTYTLEKATLKVYRRRDHELRAETIGLEIQLKVAQEEAERYKAWTRLHEVSGGVDRGDKPF